MSSPSTRRAPIWVIAVAALILGSACEEEVKGPSTRSEIEVRLPKSPSFEVRPEPPKHADGALSIAGLLRSADRSAGHEVTVRGLVADTVPCVPDPGLEVPKRGKGKAAKDECHPPPHLYLADDVEAQRDRLLIVGWSPNKVLGVRRGQELTFHGRFQRVSPGGTFIRQAGLLVVPE